jgi:hypothetical protein
MGVKVRFTRSWALYVGGEHAYFAEADARRLVKSLRVAVYCDTHSDKALETAALAAAGTASTSAPVESGPPSAAGDSGTVADAKPAAGPPSPPAAPPAQPEGHRFGRKHRR